MGDSVKKPADTGDAPAVETHGLARRFGEVPAVRGLDLFLRRGGMHGLVGPDGAGKSTAIRMLCTLCEPDEGHARILGLDLMRDRHEIRRRVGYLSQEFTLYGDLTVDENIAFFAHLHNVLAFRPRRDRLLEMTGLAPFRKRLAGRLSGGMKKKLALACTLVHTPELLLLDEPSTGVDPVSRGEFWNLLSGAVGEGMTVLLTTPYLDEAERCDEVHLMYGGRVVSAGSPAAVRAAFPGRMVQIESPDPPGLYRRLRARWTSDRLVLYGEHVRLWLPHGEDDANELRQALSTETVKVRWRWAEPTLEDAFVAMAHDAAIAGANP